MNKDRATEKHIAWTTKALNAFLPLYRDIEELQIAQRNPAKVRNLLVHGTQGDIQKLHNLVLQKLGTTKQQQRQKRAWQYDFWYSEEDDEMEEIPVQNPPSNKVEKTWLNDVVDLYMRHQYTWDSAEEVEIVQQEVDDEESEEEEGNVSSDEDDFDWL
jgi:hypothetical protein